MVYKVVWYTGGSYLKNGIYDIIINQFDSSNWKNVQNTWISINKE